jgi:hypothetical protein
MENLFLDEKEFSFFQSSIHSMYPSKREGHTERDALLFCCECPILATKFHVKRAAPVLDLTAIRRTFVLLSALCLCVYHEKP